MLTNITTRPVFLGIPGVLFVWAAISGLMWLLLNHTTEKTCTPSGSTAPRRHLERERQPGGHRHYALCSALAAFGGFIFLGYYQHVFLNLGAPYTLPAVAAVVMGGTLLSGGIGGYWGTISGAVVLTLITSLLTTLRMSEFAREIVYGLILLGLLAAYGRQRSLRQ